MSEFMKKLHRSDDRDERGFTLLELMVVVLIIGILLAFAIPQFLKARSGSQEKQAQSNVRVALSASAQYLEDNGSYAALDATTIADYENSVQYGTVSATNNSNTIGVVTLDDYRVVFASRSDSGRCYFITSVISEENGAGWVPGTYYSNDTATGACDPANAATPPAAGGNADGNSTSAKQGWKKP